VDKSINIILIGSTANYPVYITTESGASFGHSVPGAQLVTYVVDLASKHDISQININGSRAFAEPVAKEIKMVAASCYGKNNLEIEVIEQ
jgi:hypothetical protein